jgi:hypothetical protein
MLFHSNQCKLFKYQYLTKLLNNFYYFNINNNNKIDVCFKQNDLIHKMKRNKFIFNENEDKSDNKSNNRKKFNKWNNNLFDVCEQSLIISKEQTFTLIKDKYPKV